MPKYVENADTSRPTRLEVDGAMVTEVECEKVTDSSEESPWFSMGTVRERRTVRKEE